MKSDLETIFRYFPELTGSQQAQLERLNELYVYWNERINVISRKDIEHFYIRHVLHSMSIAKVISFAPGTRVLDIGTGGGFPGIPLAILFPKVKFHLIDSTGKKILVVKEVSQALALGNVKAIHARAEDVNEKYHFIVSRAVADMSKYMPLVKGRILDEQINTMLNGVLALKGGDLDDELKPFPTAVQYSLTEFFDDPFFETKKLVYLALRP